MKLRGEQITGRSHDTFEEICRILMHKPTCCKNYRGAQSSKRKTNLTCFNPAEPEWGARSNAVNLAILGYPAFETKRCGSRELLVISSRKLATA